MQILEECNGNIVKAAEVFGVAFRTIYNHLGSDRWFADSVAIIKNKLANGPLYNSLLNRALDEKSPAGVTAAIWLQKNLDKKNWNPESRESPSVNIQINTGLVAEHPTHPLTTTASVDGESENRTHIIGHSDTQQVVVDDSKKYHRGRDAHRGRRIIKVTPRPCGCGTRGPHKVGCVHAKGSGLSNIQGAVNVTDAPHTAPTQKESDSFAQTQKEKTFQMEETIDAPTA